MPDPRNPLSYEATFRELTDVLASLPDNFELPCDTKSEAINFRRRFYSYIKALEGAAFNGRFPEAVRREYAESARLCRSYSVSLTSTTPPALAFQLRDSTPFARKMSKRIAEAAAEQGIPLAARRYTAGTPPEDEETDLRNLGERVHKEAILRDTEKRISSYGSSQRDPEDPEDQELVDTQQNPLPGTEPVDR